MIAQEFLIRLVKDKRRKEYCSYVSGGRSLLCVEKGCQTERLWGKIDCCWDCKNKVDLEGLYLLTLVEN